MKISECTDRPVLTPCGLQGFDYQVDPYIGCEHYCHYCYVLGQAETDWSKEICIHKDIVAQLGKEMDGISPQRIYMGYHTDPYQPCEKEYLQTRKVLALFLERGCSASILTKSDLVCRDIDILKEMKDAAVSVSVAFNDNQTRRMFEAGTMDTERRIEAISLLKEAGIKTGALVCPVIPHITDAVRLIGQLERYADEIWIYGLSINDRSDPSWLNLQRILNDRFPDLTGQIEPIIFSKDHVYWTHLRKTLASIKKNRSLNLNIHL